MTDHDHNQHHGHHHSDAAGAHHNGAAHDHSAGHGHDDWFRHTADEPHAQQEHGQLNAGLISAYLIGTVLLVAVVSLAVFQYFQAVVRHDKRVMQELRTPREQYVEAVTKWNEELISARWIDPAKGVVRVPIETAMKNVIAEYKSR